MSAILEQIYVCNQYVFNKVGAHRVHDCFVSFVFINNYI